MSAWTVLAADASRARPAPAESSPGARAALVRPWGESRNTPEALQPVNARLAEPWGAFRKTLERQLRQRIEEGRRTTGEVRVPRLRAEEVDLSAAPGYLALDSSRFRLGLPVDPAGWRVKLAGRLETWHRIGLGIGSTQIKIKIPVSVQIAFRALVDAEVRPTAAHPEVPELAPRFPRGTATLHLDFDQPFDDDVTANLFFPNGEYATGTYPIQGASQEVTVSQIEAQEYSGTVRQPNGKPIHSRARLHLEVERGKHAGLYLRGRVKTSVRVLFFRVPVTVPIDEQIADLEALPQLLTDLLTGHADDLPQRWGRETVTLTPAPPTIDFAGAAARLERSIVRHMPYGAVFDIRRSTTLACRPEVAAPSPPRAGESYGGYIDSALWTGHYLAAEAFRYHSTHREDRGAALFRIERSLRGLRNLFAVTGREGLLARSALPAQSSIQTDPPLNDPPEQTRQRYYGPVRIDGEEWYGYGAAEHAPSRDQYTGVMLGLGYAYHFLGRPTADGEPPGPQAEALREDAGRQIRAALLYLIRNRWTVPTPPNGDIKVHFLNDFFGRLMFLRVGRMVSPEEFSAAYQEMERAYPAFWPEMWAACLDPIGKYYKFNLLHAQLGMLLFLEGVEPPDTRLGGRDRPAAQALRDCYAMLRRTTRHHRNAYFDLLRVLVEPPEDRARILADQSRGCDPRLPLRDEIRAIMHEWLVRASDEGRFRHPNQATPDPGYLLRLFPDRVAPYDPLFPKVGDESLEARTGKTMAVALEALPVDKRPGRRSDFLWQRDPFTTGLWLDLTSEGSGSEVELDPGSPELISPGIDYLLPYWMGRYLGVF